MLSRGSIILILQCLIITCKTGSSKTILALGGNGQLGAACMERLIEKGDNLMVVNRGNWYWDTDKTIRPFVKLIKCDRRKSLGECPGMDFMLHGEQRDLVFDAVVDFSSFRGENVADILEILRGRIKRYIFISSDSVYEVCMKNHTNPTVESDSVRPVPEQDMLSYSQRDLYGNRKKEGEEVLERQAEGGVPYVVLRLPDVIGARDNTNRWWIYQLWVKLSEYLDRPVSVPDDLKDHHLSFVYAYDVADLIVILLDADLDLYHQAYNLAFDENPYLRDVLVNIAIQLDHPNVQIHINNNPTVSYLWPSETSQKQYDIPELSFTTSAWPPSIFMYPSVSLGRIDTTKAKKMLNWKPTPFSEALAKTVQFFEKAMVNDAFEEERREIKRILFTHFSRNADQVEKGIDAMYRRERSKREEL